MLTVLSVEVRKLNRSLALVLAATAPALIAVFVFSMLLRSKTPSEWDMWIGSGMAIWAYFMMPLCVAALTGVARPWNMPRCFRPALFEPDRRGARLGADQCSGRIGEFKKGLLIQTFGPAKVWSPAGARPGALQRTGEALARRIGRKADDRNELAATNARCPTHLL